MAVVLVWASMAHSAMRTGKELLGYCTAALRFTDQMDHALTLLDGWECLEYLDGVMEGYQESPGFWRTWPGHVATPTLCLPPRVTRTQLIRIVVQSLHAAPQSLHLPAARLVLRAVTDAFPCPSPETAPPADPAPPPRNSRQR
jgi:hypothetical protein